MGSLKEENEVETKKKDERGDGRGSSERGK